MRRRLPSRGFTLIELMVALGAGAAVGLAAMILSRNATKFFQSEARITSAQLSATLGLNRLASDLQRAAYMSTPNIRADPSRCGATAGWPGGLAQLSGLTILKEGSMAAHGAELDQSVANGFLPDSVVIGGSFDTTEQFSVRTCEPGGAGGGYSISLQIDSGPLQRSIASAQQGGASLTDVFRKGRFLRVTDHEGKHQYGVISSLQITGAPPTAVVVHLTNNPALQDHAGNTCGFKGFCTGYLASPITRVRYDIRSVAGDACFNEITRKDRAADILTGDDKRTELVRVELDENNNEVAGTLELVAEYAVDLKFGLVRATAGPNPVVDQRLPLTKLGDDNVYTIAGDITTGTASPERIRGIQVRLTTRGRAPDRDVDMPVGADGRKVRFRLDTGAPIPRFTRLRTLYADVALPNMTGVTW